LIKNFYIAIRDGRISWEDALALVRNIDGDFSTDNSKDFCYYVGTIVECELLMGL